MHFLFLSPATLVKSRPKPTLRTTLLILGAFAFARPMSQSTSIPQKQQRVRDHGYDNYMEVEKKIRKILKFRDLLLSQPSQTLPASRFDILARRLGYKQHEAGAFVLKFPHVFEIYEHPVQRVLYCRLTRKAVAQMEQERQALQEQLPDAVTRLRKLVMMSNTGRLRLEHVRIARKEFGLPEDFEYSVEDDEVIIPQNSLIEVNQSGLLMETMIDITPRDPILMPPVGPNEGLLLCDRQKIRGNQGKNVKGHRNLFDKLNCRRATLPISEMMLTVLLDKHRAPRWLSQVFYYLVLVMLPFLQLVTSTLLATKLFSYHNIGNDKQLRNCFFLCLV